MLQYDLLWIAVSAVMSLSEDTPTPKELAFHYAPVHYQDTDSSDYPSEYITAIDYDGDWIGRNNWDHRGDGLWPATVYYSVVDTCTHTFVIYAFFHPRDWSDWFLDAEHENDLEGALLLIRKDDTRYGQLEGMITVFHRDFFSFVPLDSAVIDGHEDIDGILSFQEHNGVDRVMTVQEAKGHGLQAWPYTSDFDGAPDQDGVIYVPTMGEAETPASGNDRKVAYRLESIFADDGLWDHALTDASVPAGFGDTFQAWGTFDGDTSGGCGSGLKHCTSDSANAPWGWDDHDDGASYRGEFALDPAHLVEHYFDGLDPWSSDYLQHRYLDELEAEGYSNEHLPDGFSSSIDLDALYRRRVTACE